MMNNESFLNTLMNKNLSDAEVRELLIKELSNPIKESIESSSYDNDRILLAKQCRHEYKKIWNLLSNQSKKDLELAYFYSEFIDKIGDDQTTPINKLTKTVENEIRDKLFIEFAKGYKDRRLVLVNETDNIVDSFIKSYLNKNEPHITLGQMLNTIRFSSFNNTLSNYAYELKSYIIDNDKWDEHKFYSKKDKKYYIDYPDKYRNDSSHSYIYDLSITKECMNTTKEILHWFIGSINE